jgi:hypothetical protein
VTGGVAVRGDGLDPSVQGQRLARLEPTVDGAALLHVPVATGRLPLDHVRLVGAGPDGRLRRLDERRE